MDTHADANRDASGQLLSKAAALPALLCLLAWMFSYPSMDTAEKLLTEEFLDECDRLSEVAGIYCAALRKAGQEARVSLRGQRDANPRALRQEHTRLFITPPVQIPTEGRCWVKGRQGDVRTKGERATVAQLYRRLGLKNRAGVADPADCLVSQLDFACYVTAAEAYAWQENDAANAREWERLRLAFVQEHLSCVALGVAGEILRLSVHPLLRYGAVLLENATRALLQEEETAAPKGLGIIC